MEYAFNLTDSGRITPAALPPRITGRTRKTLDPDRSGATLEDARDRFERAYLSVILKRCDGNVSRED